MKKASLEKRLASIEAQLSLLWEFVTSQSKQEFNLFRAQTGQLLLNKKDQPKKVYTFRRGGATHTVTGENRVLAKARLRELLKQDLPMIYVARGDGGSHVHSPNRKAEARPAAIVNRKSQKPGHDGHHNGGK